MSHRQSPCLTRYIKGVNTGYGGCGLAHRHTHRLTHRHTHVLTEKHTHTCTQSISERKTKGDETV